MQNYLTQFLADLADATQNLAWPYIKQTEVSLHDWKSAEEEEATAAIRNLPQWTGILPEMFPPSGMLKDEEIHEVLKSITIVRIKK